jgi:hypothetical protein
VALVSCSRCCRIDDSAAFRRNAVYTVAESVQLHHPGRPPWNAAVIRTALIIALNVRRVRCMHGKMNI